MNALALPGGCILAANDKVNIITTLKNKTTGIVVKFREIGNSGWMNVRVGKETEWVSVENQIQHFGEDGIKITA
jgi:hypothetical protein